MTRAEWADADLAILSAGGVTIGLYPTASLKETTHIIRHSGLRCCFAEDDAILETLLSIRETLGQPETLVVFATRRTSLPPGVLTWEDFKAEGRILDERAPERFGAICRAVRPEDLATIAYTSGTTGPPKGAMITHANLYHTALNATRMHHYEESDFGLAFLPLTHMLQRMTVYAAMHLGIVGAYAESIDRLVDNFRELKPTVQVSVPQIFERIYNRIQQTLAGGSPLKGRIFRRTYLTALVTLHDDEVRALAERENLSSPPPASPTVVSYAPRIRTPRSPTGIPSRSSHCP